MARQRGKTIKTFFNKDIVKRACDILVYDLKDGNYANVARLAKCTRQHAHFILTGGTIDSYYEAAKDTAVPNKKSQGIPAAQRQECVSELSESGACPAAVSPGAFLESRGMWDNRWTS